MPLVPPALWHRNAQSCSAGGLPQPSSLRQEQFGAKAAVPAFGTQVGKGQRGEEVPNRRELPP